VAAISQSLFYQRRSDQGRSEAVSVKTRVPVNNELRCDKHSTLSNRIARRSHKARHRYEPSPTREGKAAWSPRRPELHKADASSRPLSALGRQEPCLSPATDVSAPPDVSRSAITQNSAHRSRLMPRKHNSQTLIMHLPIRHAATGIFYIHCFKQHGKEGRPCLPATRVAPESFP